VTKTLTVLAEASTDVEIEHADRYHEIGAITRTMGVFKNNRTRSRGVPNLSGSRRTRK
jgi:methyl-accepting chemotaxis protein